MRSTFGLRSLTVAALKKPYAMDAPFPLAYARRMCHAPRGVTLEPVRLDTPVFPGTKAIRSRFADREVSPDTEVAQ